MLYSRVDVEQLIIEAKESIDTIWIITAAVWVMMMQIGFAMFEAGSIRSKNTSNILLKCVVDIFTGVIAFYLFGYGLMTDLQGGIIGTGPFGGNFSNRKQILDFLFSYSFCATSSTIVSGAMAERIYIDTYIAYSMLMTALIYPIGAGWAWGNGWLQLLGYKDFSGSGVVHIVGGFAGLVGTYICGPRLGILGKYLSSSKESQESPNAGRTTQKQSDESQDRESKSQNKNNQSQSDDISQPQFSISVQDNPLYENSTSLPLAQRIKIFKSEFPEFSEYDNQSIIHLITLYDENFEKKFQYYSIPLIVSGTYLLWVCWLFFNASAGKTITQRGYENVPHMTIMNTMICGSVSSLVVFYCYPYLMNKQIISYNPVNICNGLIAGLVSITASCNNVENYSAFVIGIIGGLIFIMACKLLEHLKIDDPCCASQIHGFCGIWGVLAVGFFDRNHGLIYTGNFRQLGVQIVGALALIIWTGVITYPYFCLLNKIKRLRVSALYEIIGMDILMHEEREKLAHISKETLQVLEEKRRAQEIMDQRRRLERRQNIQIKIRNAEYQRKQILRLQKFDDHLQL